MEARGKMGEAEEGVGWEVGGGRGKSAVKAAAGCFLASRTPRGCALRSHYANDAIVGQTGWAKPAPLTIHRVATLVVELVTLGKGHDDLLAQVEAICT